MLFTESPVWAWHTCCARLLGLRRWMGMGNKTPRPHKIAVA